MQQKNFKILALPSVENISQVAKKFPFVVDIVEGKFKNIEFAFQNNTLTIKHDGVDLRDFSLVWLSSSWTSRDLAYAIKLYLKKSKTPCTYVEKGTSKVTDHAIFALNGIQAPDTLFLGHKDFEKSIDIINEICGYPLVIKDTRGSRGAHSVLVETKEDLLEEIKKLPKHKKYLLQKYIPNDYDWGIMVANGKVVSGEKSYPCDGEFRNNTCNGAEEVFVRPCDIPEKIKEMALKSSKLLGLSWSRSDIIIDKNTKNPYIMEVNRRPGLTSEESETSEINGAYDFLSSQIKAIAK